MHKTATGITISKKLADTQIYFTEVHNFFAFQKLLIAFKNTGSLMLNTKCLDKWVV